MMHRPTERLFRTASLTAFAAALILTPPTLAPTASIGWVSGSAQAAEQERGPHISVVGEGTVDIAPDMAILFLGVVREAKTARQALSDNNEAMAEVLAAMKENGIEDRDLQTSNFSVRPNYTHFRPTQNGEQKPPEITGYTVSNNLTVRVRDLAALGEIIDRSVTLGVNQGGDITFTNDNPTEAIATARAEAMKDARARAETLAQAAGVDLDSILEINEGFNRPGPVPMAKGRMMMEAAADSVPVAAGENTYTVTVSVVFGIDQ